MSNDPLSAYLTPLGMLDANNPGNFPLVETFFDEKDQDKFTSGTSGGWPATNQQAIEQGYIIVLDTHVGSIDIPASLVKRFGQRRVPTLLIFIHKIFELNNLRMNALHDDIMPSVNVLHEIPGNRIIALTRETIEVLDECWNDAMSTAMRDENGYGDDDDWDENSW